MRPPLLASATSLNFIAEVVNGLSLPTIVASLRVTVCAGAALGWSSTAAVRNATKHFIEASTAARVGTGARPILVLAIYPPGAPPVTTATRLLAMAQIPGMTAASLLSFGSCWAPLPEPAQTEPVREQ